MRIAIVSMPWGVVNIAPLGPAVLKAYLEKRGHRVDCLYLSLPFAARNKDIFQAFHRSFIPGYWMEWFFGYHLFGPGGTGELSHTLDDLYALGFTRGYLQEFENSYAQPRARLQALVQQDIPRFLGECIEDIPWGDYDLIGFSSLFWSHTACLKLAREIKARHPRTPIVFGGANVDGEMGIATLKGCEWVDYVVEREGERAFLALIENLDAAKPFESVPNVSFRRGKEVIACKTNFPPMDMNELSTPDHGDFFDQLRQTGVDRWVQPEVTFEASRGCWWGQKQHCVFCGFNRQGITFRSRSAELIVADVVGLYERFHQPLMRSTDDIMAVEHYATLVPKLKKARERLGADWDIWWETKANLTATQIASFHEAGIRRLQPGIESFSSEILRLMKKGSRAIQNIQTIKASASVGTDVYYSLLYGFFGEDPKEYDRMADLLLSLTHLTPADSYSLRIDRFSPMHFDWRNFGNAKPIADWFYSLIYPAERFTLDEIAYFFRSPDSDRTAIDEYTAHFRKAAENWRWVHALSVFEYSPLPGGVRIVDSRPGNWSAQPVAKEYFLEGKDALVFRACETLQTFGQILEACRRANPNCGETEVRAILDDFVAKRWVIREETQYLNLAQLAPFVKSRQPALPAASV